MTQLTNTGLSAISKTHEDVMSGLFRLTIRPPKKIEVTQEHTLAFPSVACYTGQSPLDGPIEANTHLISVLEVFEERPF